MRALRTLWERFSLRVKLPVLFLLGLLSAQTYFSWAFYHTTLDDFLRGVDLRLWMCVEAVDAIVPNDYHDRAVSPEAIQPEEWERLRERLAAVATKAGLSYIYVLAPVGGGLYCTASNTVPYFTPYDEKWESLALTLDDGRERFSTGTDSYGTSRSIISRRLSAGGAYYCIGADLPIPEIEREEARRLKGIAAYTVIAVILAGLIGCAMSRFVTRPQERLTRFISRVGGNGFAGAERLDRSLLPISEHPADEVRLLARSFDNMQIELAGYLSRLEEAAAARERAEGEMRVAGGIQQGLLPTRTPASPRFDIGGAMTPAKSAGGDLFDYFPLDARRLCFAVGDVSGKGMPAAMFMASSLTLFRAYAEELASLADPGEFLIGTLRRVDASLAKHNSAMLFVTMLAGVLDQETGEAILACGAHNPPLRIRAGGGAEYLSLPPGGLMGVGMGAEFQAVRLRLNPGDALFLYTDGVTEAQARDGEFFGEDRLRDLLAAAPDRSPASLMAAIQGAVAAFAEGQDPADDITVLALRWNG